MIFSRTFRWLGGCLSSMKAESALITAKNAIFPEHNVDSALLDFSTEAESVLSTAHNVHFQKVTTTRLGLVPSYSRVGFPLDHGTSYLGSFCGFFSSFFNWRASIFFSKCPAIVKATILAQTYPNTITINPITPKWSNYCKLE